MMTELTMSVVSSETYPLLGELTGTLVTAVAEQFDDTALVGGEAKNMVLASWAKC